MGSISSPDREWSGTLNKLEQIIPPDAADDAGIRRPRRASAAFLPGRLGAWRKLRPALRRIDRLFAIVVMLPTLCAVLYFGLIASPVYISESSFVVYSPNQETGSAGLLGILGTLGGSNSTSAADTISDYTTSWAALTALNDEYGLKSIYGNGNIDIFDRFGGVFYPYSSMVRLWRYYRNMVTDTLGSDTGISTLTVKAYTPGDAQKINAFLLAKSQDIVNQLNADAREKAVYYAQQDVDSAREKLVDATLAVAKYRNGQMVFDPKSQSGVQMSLVEQLQNKLIEQTIELASLMARTPRNPQIPVIRGTIASLQSQIAAEQAKITGPDVSLASKDTGYELLQVNLTLDQSLLASAVSSLEQARLTAQKQELYLETISPPNLPDAPQEPLRLEGILATLFVSLMIWGILRIVIGGIREHQGQ